MSISTVGLSSLAGSLLVASSALAESKNPQIAYVGQAGHNMVVVEVDDGQNPTHLQAREVGMDGVNLNPSYSLLYHPCGIDGERPAISSDSNGAMVAYVIKAGAQYSDGYGNCATLMGDIVMAAYWDHQGLPYSALHVSSLPDDVLEIDVAWSEILQRFLVAWTTNSGKVLGRFLQRIPQSPGFLPDGPVLSIFSTTSVAGIPAIQSLSVAGANGGNQADFFVVGFRDDSKLQLARVDGTASPPTQVAYQATGNHFISGIDVTSNSYTSGQDNSFGLAFTLEIPDQAVYPGDPCVNGKCPLGLTCDLQRSECFYVIPGESQLRARLYSHTDVSTDLTTICTDDDLGERLHNEHPLVNGSQPPKPDPVLLPNLTYLSESDVLLAFDSRGPIPSLPGPTTNLGIMGMRLSPHPTELGQCDLGFYVQDYPLVQDDEYPTSHQCVDDPITSDVDVAFDGFEAVLVHESICTDADVHSSAMDITGNYLFPIVTPFVDSPVN